MPRCVRSMAIVVPILGRLHQHCPVIASEFVSSGFSKLKLSNYKARCIYLLLVFFPTTIDRCYWSAQKNKPANTKIIKALKLSNHQTSQFFFIIPKLQTPFLLWFKTVSTQKYFTWSYIQHGQWAQDVLEATELMFTCNDVSICCWQTVLWGSWFELSQDMCTELGLTWKYRKLKCGSDP